MSLEELQGILDESTAKASRFARELFPEPPRAEQVARLINEAHELTVATASSRGIPHAALVVAGCIDGAILFTVTPTSILHRNLEASSRCAVTCTSGPAGVMSQGRAVSQGDYGTQPPNVQRHFGERLAGYEGLIYRFAPKRLFAQFS